MTTQPEQQCWSVGPETGRRCTRGTGHQGDHEWVSYVHYPGAIWGRQVWDRSSWPQTV